MQVHHPARSAAAAGAGSGQPSLRRRRAERLVGGRHQCAMKARFAMRRKEKRRSANRGGLILDRQLQCCLAPVEAGRKGAAKLGRLLTAGCHTQSSLNCTERGRSATAGRATARSMVRQRSVRWKPLYLATTRLTDGSRGEIRLGLKFPSGGCEQVHSAMEFLPQPSPRATRGRARHLRI